jgi:DNA-binding response OmpR family regulator
MRMQNSAGGAKRILVVEDEPAISQVCHRILTGGGFEVDAAINGEVAQEMLGERDYTLVLIDIRMPVMSGKEFYQLIKSQCPQLVDRVIFVTGDVIGSATKNFLEQSGRPVLAKPFTPDELKTIVGETLRQAEK